MKTSKPNTIAEYIKTLPKETQPYVKELRAIVKKLAPAAEEGVSYGIPVFKLYGQMFIYIAGFKKHVSMYPAPRGSEQFKEALSQYKGGKGTVQFPLDEKLPTSLIKRIVKFRMADSKLRAKLKAARSK